MCLPVIEKKNSHLIFKQFKSEENFVKGYMNISDPLNKNKILNPELIFVPLMAWFTTIFNWQYVVIPVLIGSITCSILFLFFGKSWPSELKIPPYGDNKIYNPPLPSKESAVYISFINLYNAINNPAFIILAATFFICGLTSNGLILQHFIPFCADNNIGIVVSEKETKGVELSANNIDLFWQTMNEINVWNWKREYSPEEVYSKVIEALNSRP